MITISKYSSIAVVAPPSFKGMPCLIRRTILEAKKLYNYAPTKRHVSLMVELTFPKVSATRPILHNSSQKFPTSPILAMRQILQQPQFRQTEWPYRNMKMAYLHVVIFVPNSTVKIYIHRDKFP